MTIRFPLTATLFLIALLGLSACSLDISREADGSLRVAGAITEQEPESELALAIADPLVEKLEVDVRDGALFASGQRRHPDGSGVDTLAVRVDLGRHEGCLTATVSEAAANGEPLAAWRVAGWNERLAARLERAAGRRPNSTLQGVSVEEDTVILVWQVETPRSRGRAATVPLAGARCCSSRSGREAPAGPACGGLSRFRGSP